MREFGEMTGSERALHALNRLAFGPRPGDYEHVRAIGAEAYIHQQLNLESIEIPMSLVDRVHDLRTLHMTPAALFVEYQRPIQMARRQNDKDDQKDLRKRARVVIREAVEARLLRAIEGPRQLQEVLTAFWFNHFNIFAGKGLCDVWTGSFEELAIRPHTLGRFRDLLGATARHPAMLFYLDNWQNTAPNAPGATKRFDGINENYARELMELHTLGVSGGYTQADVIALAHILTGWGLPRAGGGRPRDTRDMEEGVEVLRSRSFMRRRMWNRFDAQPSYASGAAFYFDASRHDFGRKTLLGHTIESGGEREVEEALDLLARHPSTAKHISYQLAQYFVADDPPALLVTKMASRYAQSDGHIREVLATMFASDEFWDPRNFHTKYKTPYEYVISSVRAAGTLVTNFRPLAGTMQLLGMPTYGCLMPNGYPNTQEAWLNPDAMMARLSFASALGNGNLPLEAPPFDPDDGGTRGYFNKKGVANIKLDANPARAGRRMTAPDATALVSTLGNDFSAKTRGAIEAAPPQLRAAMVLGSPEFMMR